MQAPTMTPEMMMQQGGGQAPMQEQAPAQVTPDEIAEAKRMLGLDVLEESMKYDKSLATVLQEYPELTKAAIEKELAKMEEKDPSIAKQIRSSEVGMMMFAKGIMPSIKPNAKPDNITDDGDTGAQGGGEDELETKVKTGNASKVELGEYLGRFKQTK